MDDEKFPFVDKRVVEYLEKTYTMKFCVNKCISNMDTEIEGDFALGYMAGVVEIIDRLNAIVRQQEGDD